jgi:CheY-like chemotaxis protein
MPIRCTPSDTLVIVSDTSPGVEKAEAESARAPESLRVLVVDDSEDIRALMVRMVTKLGHSVAEAEDGVEAVQALAQSSYDLMLLDLSMPNMTGEEVVRWVREHPEHGEGLNIVVISAWAGDMRPVLNELGVTRVLPKPFRQRQLADLINEIENSG